MVFHHESTTPRYEGLSSSFMNYLLPKKQNNGEIIFPAFPPSSLLWDGKWNFDLSNNKPNNGNVQLLIFHLQKRQAQDTQKEKDKPSGKFLWIDFSFHGSMSGPSPLSRPSPSLWRSWGSEDAALGTGWEHCGVHTPLINTARSTVPTLKWRGKAPTMSPGSGPAPGQPHHTAAVTTGLLKNSLQIIHTNLFKGANGFNY